MTPAASPGPSSHRRPGAAPRLARAIGRAWAALRPGLSVADRTTLRLMLADALAYRTADIGGYCADCDRSPGLLCADHATDLALADLYRELAAGLGVVIADA